jgi:WD40 repeat protein
MLSAASSSEGGRVATASQDRTARLWEAASAREFATLRGHGAAVLSVAFSPDGARAATASRDGTARVWDAATGAELAILRGHGAAVRSAAFSPDGGRVATASEDRTARVWGTGSGAEITRILLYAAVTALAVHDGCFALGDALGCVHVFDAQEFLRGKGGGP